MSFLRHPFWIGDCQLEISLRYLDDPQKPEVVDPIVMATPLSEKKDSHAFTELYSLIGLDQVKNLSGKSRLFLVQRKRAEENIKSEPIVLHMVLRAIQVPERQQWPESWGSCLREWAFKQGTPAGGRRSRSGRRIHRTYRSKTREQIRRSLGESSSLTKPIPWLKGRQGFRQGSHRYAGQEPGGPPR